jgi:hypothetical protein
MNVTICIFEGMTALNFVGANDLITRLKEIGFINHDWDICTRSEAVAADHLRIGVDHVDRIYRGTTSSYFHTDARRATSAATRRSSYGFGLL